MRYSRGLGTWGFLREQAPHLTRLDALLISHWTAGAGRAIAADPGLDDRVRAALLKANDIFAR